jgi:hypothetical protein
MPPSRRPDHLLTVSTPLPLFPTVLPALYHKPNTSHLAIYLREEKDAACTPMRGPSHHLDDALEVKV